jgi:hypothetical protein
VGQKPEEVKQKPEEIKREIAQTREELGEKVEELAGRFHKTVDEVKSKSIKVAGVAVAALVGLLVIRRLRRR